MIYRTQYRVEKDLDFCNVGSFPMSKGAFVLSELNKLGWNPIMILDWGASGFKTAMLLARNRWFWQGDD